MSELKNLNNPSLPVIGITLGDVNGIGPEILIRLLEDSRLLRLFTPVVYGNHRIINRYRKQMGVEDIQMVPCRNPEQIAPRKINMFNCWEEDYEIKPGNSDPEAGRFALLALNHATEHLKAGHIQALVTGPINKSNMPADGFPFPGQTEYFAKAAGVPDALMMMVHPNIRVALATVHLPLEKIPGLLTRNLVVQKINQLENVLIQEFDIPQPRIAVLGLNPHAGENGKLGQEEETILGPVIRDFRGKGKQVYGPFPADGFFASGQGHRFDAVLAMYHDQGLVPFKLIAGLEGVNYSAGLPFIRVSPDHGTAYDIAGRNIANPDSLRSAVFQAIDLIRLKTDKIIPVISNRSMQSSTGAPRRTD
jgi:4-hydroxythreonine-4-phosphate dehydrogenase